MENIKKTLSAFIFTLFLSLLLINCKDPKGQKPNDDPKTETVEKPAEVIEVEVARQQYLTYENRRVDLIQKYEDSFDGYDDKGVRQQQNDQRLEADPKYIEQEAKTANVEISTLRFYFSNYPADDTAAVHPRQNSIIITPTLHENNREYIFSIDESDIKNIKPLLLTDGFVPISDQEKGMGNIIDKEKRNYASFLPESLNISSEAPAFQSGKSVSMNKGNSAPPPHSEQ